MKEYNAKVIELETGNIRHITGKWDSWETMDKELLKDGYVLVWFEQAEE